jgi:hypothetical protein
MDGQISWARNIYVGQVGVLSALRQQYLINVFIRRSVFNTRIERLWRDYKQAVSEKWKDFLADLEHNYNLNPDNQAHIWLLHWLFLDAINKDLDEWVNAWNHHKISLPGEPDRSPRDMYIFGMLEDGPRGMDYDALVQQVEQEIHNHAHAEQPPPQNLNQVICETDNSVIPPAFEEILEQRLVGLDFSTQSMAVRRLIWQVSLQASCDLAAELGFNFT